MLFWQPPSCWLGQSKKLQIFLPNVPFCSLAQYKLCDSRQNTMTESSEPIQNESSPSLRILLLGAAGFIGSYVQQQLLSEGMQVVAACRELNPNLPSKPQLQWRALHLQSMLQAEDWHPHLKEIDVVINCVGILRQRIGERYEDLHHRMPAALAHSCARSGVRLIHTSALGLHEEAKSRFLSSKLSGEQAIAASGADYCIVRPNLGLAFTALAKLPNLADFRQANLGGTRHFAYAEYLQLLRGVESANAKPALQIPLPNWMSRIGSHFCDLFRFSPFSYGHWILLQRDNLPLPNALPRLLGREPEAVTYTRVALADDFRLS
jgi:hypothetical protein